MNISLKYLYEDVKKKINVTDKERLFLLYMRNNKDKFFDLAYDYAYDDKQNVKEMIESIGFYDDNMKKNALNFVNIKDAKLLTSLNEDEEKNAFWQLSLKFAETSKEIDEIMSDNIFIKKYDAGKYKICVYGYRHKNRKDTFEKIPEHSYGIIITK